MSDLCWCADFEPAEEREGVVCPSCRALLLRGRGESRGRFQRRLRRHRMTHGTRRRALVALCLAMVTIVAGDVPRAPAQTFTVAHYTVPSSQVAADTVCIPGATAEKMGQIVVWWWPQGGNPYVLRVKSVAGMEGLPDTLRLPASPAALCRLHAVDAAGNQACNDELAWVPYNQSSAVGIGPPPVWRRHLIPGRPFDVQGRRMEPGPSGWYFGGGRDCLVLK